MSGKITRAMQPLFALNAYNLEVVAIESDNNRDDPSWRILRDTFNKVSIKFPYWDEKSLIGATINNKTSYCAFCVASTKENFQSTMRMYSREIPIRIAVRMNEHNEIKEFRIKPPSPRIQCTWSDRFDTIEIAKHSQTMQHCYWGALFFMLHRWTVPTIRTKPERIVSVVLA